MNLNEDLQMDYEAFQGDVRKLDELISQLELWCDECTINHKKEEVRLPQYIELHLNLEELTKSLEAQALALAKEEGLEETLKKDKAYIEKRLSDYKETERIIHEWVREIKDLYILVMKSKVLETNRAYIEQIIGQ